MRMRRSLLGAGLVLLALARAAPAGDAPGAFAPYEDLLEVLSDLTWHLRDDVYRFPAPKDPTGHDIYRLSVHRLENWETRYPGRLRDVTGFGRASALERLSEFRAAADLYGQVAKLPSPLAERAREGAERSRAFAAAAALTETGPDLNATLAALRVKLDAFGKLLARYDGTPYAPLALVEEERLEQQAARLVVQNRRTLEGGDAAAERALRFMIEKHADSKNLPDHIMRLGDLYAEVARQYADEHERPLAFEEVEFVRRTDRALDVYRKVATWDGVPEKPEAQARFSALESYRTALLNRYR